MKKGSVKKTKTPARTKASAPATKTDQGFESIARAMTKEAGVTFNEGKGFGSRALKVNGKIFAMMTSKAEFVVKLPKERVAELVSARAGEYFDAGKGKPMKEWLTVDGVPRRSVALVKEAYRFVKGK